MIGRLASEMRPEGWEAGGLAVHLGLDPGVVTDALDELVRRDQLSVTWVDAGDPQGSAAHIYTPK